MPSIVRFLVILGLVDTSSGCIPPGKMGVLSGLCAMLSFAMSFPMVFISSGSRILPGCLVKKVQTRSRAFFASSCVGELAEIGEVLADLGICGTGGGCIDSDLKEWISGTLLFRFIVCRGSIAIGDSSKAPSDVGVCMACSDTLCVPSSMLSDFISAAGSTPKLGNVWLLGLLKLLLRDGRRNLLPANLGDIGLVAVSEIGAMEPYLLS